MLYEKIPKERIAVLIGHNGETKVELEERSGVKFDVNSESGEVQVHDEKAEDPVMALKVRDIVKAIARGFSPEHAFTLLRDDSYFYLFDVNDYVGKKKKHVRRIKARVIGSHGKTRELIEEMTDSLVSVYGDTVGIIGDIEGLEEAKVAVDMLLSGSEHASVYRYLESARVRLKTARMGFEYFEGKE